MKGKWMALAALMAAGMTLAGCSGGENASGEYTQEEPYEATLMYWVSSDARDVQHVEDAINELSIPQINVQVHLRPVTLGTYAQQIQMILSSDEALDVIPIYGTDAGSYIESGYLVDMSPYMETVGQDLIDIVGQEDIDCCRIGDFLWGIPTMHERCNPIGYVVRTDLLEEAGFTAEDVTSMEDMTAVYEKVHELHPEITLYSGINSLTQPCLQSTFDPLGSDYFGVLLNNGQDTVVSNWYESDQFRSWVELMYDWNQKGYISSDLSVSSDSGEALMRAGNIFSFTTYVKPNSKQEKDLATGYDTTILQVTDPVCYTSTTNSGAYGIAANSQDPEKAVELLNWIYSTKEANDLLNWGVEGTDYQVNEDGTIGFPDGVTSDNVDYHQDFGWAMPNQFNSYVWEGNDINIWDEYQEVRDNATVSKAYGFTFDTQNVENELAALRAVTDQYLVTIASGEAEPESAIQEMNDALYDAGLQTVMDEKQAQLDAWLEAQ